MKAKYLLNSTFILLLSYSLITFNSCRKDTKLWATKADGIIYQQGISTYGYGTHILINNSGQTLFALRSDNVDLDNYIGETIKLKGNKIKRYPIENGPDYLEVRRVNN